MVSEELVVGQEMVNPCSNGSANQRKPCEDIEDKDIKVYKIRHFMLFQFSVIASVTGLAYPEYVTIANTSMCYYNVSLGAVNWTGLLFMAIYIPMNLPVSAFTNRMGLRKTLLIAACLNSLGAATQYGTLGRENFPIVLLSTTFYALGMVFVLALPPLLSAVWYPENEVSRACALGVVFGNQFGTALGYVFVSSIVTSDCSDPEGIKHEKFVAATIFAVITIFFLILFIFTFQDKPKFPPSKAQLQKSDIQFSFMKAISSVIKNIPFILLIFSYGLLNGVYYAMATIINPLFSGHFPDSDTSIGWLGTLMTLAGLGGCTTAGYILDYTRKYKETSLGICILTIISFVLYSVLLEVASLWVQFISMSILGFFLISYLPVGYEYGVELTYPDPEAISAGLLNTSTMTFGILITMASTSILEAYGTIATNIFLCLILVSSFFTTAFISSDYKRQKANS